MGLISAIFAIVFTLTAAAHESKIIGTNDMIAVKADGSNVPERLVPYLDAFGIIAIGSTGACSGTHLGNGLVLTAGHCMLNASSPENVLQNASCAHIRVLWGYRGSPQTNNPRPYVSLESQCTQIIYAEQNRQRDFAIFKVDVAPRAAIRIAKESKKTPTGTKITIFGYPKGRPLEWSQYCEISKGSRAGFTQILVQSIFSHTCDTEAGNSGSSIVAFNSAGEPRVVGVHGGAAAMGMEYNYATYLYYAQKALSKAGIDLLSATAP